ncbi:TPA: hypothetical protein BOS_20798 [Bos taurus]|nr:TPA: hypothetical protein BOS_20798 [Bos taurus]
MASSPGPVYKHLVVKTVSVSKTRFGNNMTKVLKHNALVPRNSTRCHGITEFATAHNRGKSWSWAGGRGRAPPGRAAAAYPVVARAHPAGESVDRLAQTGQVLLQIRDGARCAEVEQQLLSDLQAAADVLLLHLGAEVLHAAGLHGRGRPPARPLVRGQLSPSAAQPPERGPAGTGGTRSVRPRRGSRAAAGGGSSARHPAAPQTSQTRRPPRPNPLQRPRPQATSARA